MEHPFPFQQNKPLKEICTFGIGGPAKHYIEVKQIPLMQELIKYCNLRKIPYCIVGKGSNCLFDDRGFKGLVIANKIDFIERPQPGIFHAGAGYSFSLLGVQTARQGWSGLEFASGIPASVGGAVFMNAGANGSETCETLTSVDYIDEEGSLITINRNDLTFSYRTSPFQCRTGAIVGATFRLSSSEQARKKQLEIIAYRKKTQPYGDKSAGCIFRNTNCSPAGALIDQCGLKGMQIGGAKVSEMHANFIVNAGQAASTEVIALIEYVQSKVKELKGVELESEVRCIPYDSEVS